MSVKFCNAMLVAVLGLTAATPSNAKSLLKTLYTFQGGADGTGPWGSLLLNGSVLYGVTHSGGSANAGTIFSFDLSTGIKSTLYTFTGGNDGNTPLAALTYLNGVLYGTTIRGGTAGWGVVFQYNISTAQESTLYSFQGGYDGLEPAGPLISFGGLLYGTTLFGGNGENGGLTGTLYSIDPATGVETIVSNSLCNPEGQLASVDGLLWGTNTCYVGSIFNVNTATGSTAIAASWNQYGDPYYAGPISANGLLYGTASAGGDLKCSQAGSGCGTLYSLDPSTNTLKTLYSFKGTGADIPFYSLVYNNGLLYGTTYGGKKGGGDLFSFDPITKKLTTLFSFIGGSTSKTGYFPNQLIYSGGVLYGTTLGGGCAGGTCSGTIYSFTP
jgi:uncharacterized repeat protein (TIGR03803 family)